ncbi:MAG: hypothetical protein OHK0052_02070 [Anaerolineales bacterium]
MIRINGSIQRAFVFPAPLTEALRYYANTDHILRLIPHVFFVTKYAQGQYRMLYHTTELAIYRVKIYCDLQASVEDRVLKFRPLTGHAPVKTFAGFDHLTAQGEYASDSVFESLDESHTRVTYTLYLKADLPTPLGLGLVPGAVMTGIANGITGRRMREIAQGFIDRSLVDYRKNA